MLCGYDRLGGLDMLLVGLGMLGGYDRLRGLDMLGRHDSFGGSVLLDEYVMLGEVGYAGITCYDRLCRLGMLGAYDRLCGLGMLGGYDRLFGLCMLGGYNMLFGICMLGSMTC